MKCKLFLWLYTQITYEKVRNRTLRRLTFYVYYNCHYQKRTERKRGLEGRVALIRKGIMGGGGWRWEFATCVRGVCKRSNLIASGAERGNTGAGGRDASGRIPLIMLSVLLHHYHEYYYYYYYYYYDYFEYYCCCFVTAQLV